ncbi:DUF4235 domain-containing protein [Aeromicrobium sp.]|uniref:DUF4235 domain-containing protein n=1 Tax=Aeromicrobium sp. TaxID=1871063 RepID=UPI00199912FA|nr:DUF4235 domain-containing protein [Aeromicrobium sp.]MBC7630857.1 DUF4235 domain-containing protein [Aeromicrobium sp.]
MAKKRKRAKQSGPHDVPAPRKPGGKGAWRLMDRGSSVVAGLLAQRVSATAWRVATGKKPPTSGRHPEVSTGEAVAWAMVGGGLIELVKVIVRRWTAAYWVKSTGNLPPGMKALDASPRLKRSADGSSANGKEPAPAGPAPSKTSTKKVSRRSRGR